jgi:hypothetical protein
MEIQEAAIQLEYDEQFLKLNESLQEEEVAMEGGMMLWKGFRLKMYVVCYAYNLLILNSFSLQGRVQWKY